MTSFVWLYGSAEPKDLASRIVTYLDYFDRPQRCVPFLVSEVQYHARIVFTTSRTTLLLLQNLPPKNLYVVRKYVRSIVHSLKTLSLAQSASLPVMGLVKIVRCVPDGLGYQQWADWTDSFLQETTAYGGAIAMNPNWGRDGRPAYAHR